MSWARVVASILIEGTSIFGKAFFQAYRNAAANAGKEGAAAAAAVARRGQMTRQEALEILGVEAETLKSSPQEVDEIYAKFFEANDPANGGSFYLQSKIFRAKEFLDEDMAAEAGGAAAAGDESASAAADEDQGEKKQSM